MEMIIEQVRQHYFSMDAVKYPDGFALEDHWERMRDNARRIIDSHPSVADAILFAQTPPVSGFDHRDKVELLPKDLINDLYQGIHRRFPEFSLEASPFGDSLHSRKDCLIRFGDKYISNILFYRLEAYLTCINRLCEDPETILEIGGGYGDLARMFKMGKPSVRYTILDTPESLFYAEVFLRANFLRGEFSYASLGTDFSFIPIQYYEGLLEEPFDLVVCQGVLGEMPTTTLDFWLDFLNKGKAKAFYSWNDALAKIKLNKSWKKVYQEKDPEIFISSGYQELCFKRK